MSVGMFVLFLFVAVVSIGTSSVIFLWYFVFCCELIGILLLFFDYIYIDKRNLQQTVQDYLPLTRVFTTIILVIFIAFAGFFSIVAK